MIAYDRFGYAVPEAPLEPPYYEEEDDLDEEEEDTDDWNDDVDETFYNPYMGCDDYDL